MIRWLLIAWCVVSVGSLLFYAFTGMTLWSAVAPDDYMRQVLLIFFHVCGVAAGLLYLELASHE